MWKTFKAEFHALWKSRLRFASWIILLFMPLIYGFLFLSSFWSPFKNTNKLPITVVNLDNSSLNSELLVSKLINGGKDLEFNGGSSKYKIHVTEAKDIYSSKEEVEKKVNDGTYSGAFVIPQGYGALIAKIKGAVAIDFAVHNVDAASVINIIRDEINNSSNKSLVDFYNSFKVSYVAGEMTNMGSTLYRLLGDLIFPEVEIFKPLIEDAKNELPGIIGKIAQAQSTAKGNTLISMIKAQAPSDVIDEIKKAIPEIKALATKLGPILGAVPAIQTQLSGVMADMMKLTDPKVPSAAIIPTLVAKVTDGLAVLNNAVQTLTTAQLQPLIDTVKTKVLTDLNAGNALVEHRTYGKREGVVGQHDILNTYGYGLSPYFLSIVLWAGALLMAFLFPNKRYIKTEGTFKNLMGKTAVWIITGWIQVLLLFAIISIPGIFGTLTYHIDGHAVVIKQCINLGGGQWKLIIFALFVSTVFMLIVRGILYTLRVADIGLFLCVVLLILQLVSSGGTFPVSMQPGFFQFLHKILPFTYTVNAIREIFWDTDPLVVLKDVGILLIIPSIFTTTSLITGFFWDKKTKYKKDGQTRYRSMDKNVGSL